MLNVNELTSQMAKMSDAQLRQYAQLHKTDPYTLALAASESKRRAQLRAAGQQQAAQQPTVADQMLAQMGAPAPMPQQMPQPQPQPQQMQLPEDQGIGMLPAQNMAGMADGGIAGYADGGMVAFADGDLVRTPEFDLRSGAPTVYGTNTTDVFAPVAVEETSSPAGRFFSGLFAGPEGARERYATQQDKLARERALLDRLGRLEGLGLKQQTRAQQDEAANVRKELDNLRSTRVAETKPAAAPTTTPKPSAESPTTFESKLTAPPDGARPGAGRARTPGAGTTTQQPGTATAPDFVPSKPGDLTAELARLQKMSPGTKAYDDLSAKIKKGYADLEKARDENKPKDKAYAGLEALLGKEEEKAKGKEARNYNMALVNAGLVIAGGKSQYALQNIAEGAQVGTKQYQEGLEKLEAAALERRKQSAMIEEARRAEARGDWKDAQQYKQKAFEAELGVNQAQIAAVQDLYKTDLKTASEIVNSQNTLASADQRALMQEKGLNLRAREQNVADLQRARIMAAAYGARADQRGELTPQFLLNQYNDMRTKDLRFKKDFPNFESYVAHIMKKQADPYANWGDLQVTPGKK